MTEPMEPTDAGEHDHVRDLLAAWVLGALDPEEGRAVSRHLTGCASCEAEAEGLRETVRLLDGADGEADVIPGPGPGFGPGESGDGVLALALRSRPAAAVPRVAPHAAPYAAAVSGLRALLHEVDEAAHEGAWRTPVVHDWDVQATVAHLLAADELLAVGLGLAPRVPLTPPPPGTPWHEAWAARTAEMVAHERPRDPGQTVAAWAAQAAELLATPEARDSQLASTELTLMDLPLPVAEHFVLRAFELWIHTDDIGRALGLVVPPPPEEYLWRMVDLGVRGVALATGPGDPPVRLTLGDLSTVLGVADGATEPPPVPTQLTLDPVDFCMLLGGRYEPHAVPHDVVGDENAARSVLERAASFAWL